MIDQKVVETLVVLSYLLEGDYLQLSSNSFGIENCFIDFSDFSSDLLLLIYDVIDYFFDEANFIPQLSDDLSQCLKLILNRF